MCLALNMAIMANGGFMYAAIEQTQFLIKISCSHDQEEKICGVVFPRCRKVTAAIEKHPAMICEIQTDGRLHFQNGKATNPQTCCRCKETGAPPPQLMPLPLALPPAPPWPLAGREFKVPKPNVWHPNMCIYILHSHMQNYSLLLHMPRITSSIKNLFQIC